MDIREAAKALQTAAGHGARDRESVSDDDAVAKDKVKALKKRLVEYKMNDPHLPASSRLTYAAVHANMEDRDTDAGKRRRHKDQKKGRQKKKNRKRRRCSSSSKTRSSSSASSGSSALFQKAPLLSGGNANKIRRIAEDQAGALYDSAVSSMSKLLGARGGAGPSGMSSGQCTTYLRSIMFGEHPLFQLPPDNVREIQSLVKTLDELGQGRVKSVGDLLAQRFKALELELKGRPDLARELDLTSIEEHTLASSKELGLARRERAHRLRAEKR